MIHGLVTAARAPMTLFWGVLVPGAIFLLAAFVTFLLYRHFAAPPK